MTDDSARARLIEAGAREAFDPETENALMIHHVEAGIEKLEGSRLSLEHRNAVARLALRLIRLSRKENA